MEVLNDDPDLVKVVESLTCGKIFAVEILDKSDIPLVVLYDTSGEDDININATCLKAICDKSLEVHLQVPLWWSLFSVKYVGVCGSPLQTDTTACRAARGSLFKHDSVAVLVQTLRICLF